MIVADPLGFVSSVPVAVEGHFICLIMVVLFDAMACLVLCI